MTIPVVLILIGLLLIIVEIIIVPGFGIPGVVGGISIVLGLYMAYSNNPNLGVLLTFATLVICAGLGYWAFKGNALKKMTLNSQISSKVNIHRTLNVVVGDLGTSLSKLSPTGDGQFGEKVIEVQSISGYIDVNCAIEIQKIENNTIFVTPKT